MNYLSICSGIEAASVGWHKLGWKPLGFSEIEPFPSAVLAHHYLTTPNLGDMAKHKDWSFDERLDLLVGGTPCQAFSVAGARRGLEDERGNLTLTFCNIADQFNPRFTLWENVPGVLSDKTNAFGCLLSSLAGFDEVLKSADGKWRGSGMVVGRRRRVAWVTLDAQFFGVPQRRRRIFVLAVDAQSVADSPDLCPSKILSIGQGLRRDTPTRRKAGEEITGATGVGVEGCYGIEEECNASMDHFGPLLRGGQGGTRQAVAFAQNTRDEVRYVNGDGSIAGALAAEPGMNQTTYIMSTGQAGAEIGIGIGTTLNCNHEAPIAAYAVRTANTTANGHGIAAEVTHTLDQAQGQAIATQMQVRRLTPVECERLQGFPVGYTDIKLKGKPTPDGPRYKALGNSMCTSVMRWIGGRIDAANRR